MLIEFTAPHVGTVTTSWNQVTGVMEQPNGTAWVSLKDCPIYGFDTTRPRETIVSMWQVAMSARDWHHTDVFEPVCDSVSVDLV